MYVCMYKGLGFFSIQSALLYPICTAAIARFHTNEETKFNSHLKMESALYLHMDDLS